MLDRPPVYQQGHFIDHISSIVNMPAGLLGVTKQKKNKQR